MNKKAFNKKEYCKKEAKLKSFSDLTRTGAFSNKAVEIVFDCEF